VWTQEAPRKLGRYLLGPKLGEGGMGEVYEAWDILLRRPVALKLLHSQLAAHILRFMQEAHLQARLEHPNICRVFDADASDGIPKIAMQLVRGGTLADLDPPLPPPALARLMAKVALAVHSAHQNRMVHRDLKPANILLAPDDESGWTPYVCDFGLAKDLNGPALTLTAAPLGTPAYMAPEQRTGDTSQTGPQTDIWALGATLLACLVKGPLPATEEAWLTSSTRNSLQPALQKVIDRCLRNAPSERYASAENLAEDLIRYAVGESAALSVRYFVDSFRRMIGRHPRISVASSLLVMLVLSTVGWVTHSLSLANRQIGYAQTFTSEAESIEQALKTERMLPPHDLRPAFVQVQNRIAAMRTRIQSLGSGAEGAGSYALGRAYLALQEPEEAIRELEKAWSLGFKGSDVAYALAKAHADYLLLVSQRFETGIAREKLDKIRAQHLARSKELFSFAKDQAWEPKELLKAELLDIEGHPREALTLIQPVTRTHPGDIDALLMEAKCYLTLSWNERRHGSPREGLHLAHQGDALLRKARELARSHEGVLQQRVSWQFVDVDDRVFAGECPEPKFHEALAAAEELLVLNPEHFQGLDMKLGIILDRAWSRYGSGKAFQSDVDLGGSILSHLSPELRARLAFRKQQFLLLEAQILSSKGQDPTPAVRACEQIGIRGYPLMEALNYRAKWQVRHGQDPSETVRKVVAIHQELDPVLFETYHWDLLAYAWNTQAAYEAYAGEISSVTRAAEEQNIARLRREDPNGPYTFIREAQWRCTLAQLARWKGQDRTRELEAGRVAGEKGFALAPKNIWACQALANICLEQAQDALNKKGSLEEPVQRCLKVASMGLSCMSNDSQCWLLKGRALLIQALWKKREKHPYMTDLTRASAAIKKTCALNPELTEAWIALGQVANLKGQPVAPFLREAYRINPFHPEIRGEVVRYCE